MLFSFKKIWTNLTKPQERDLDEAIREHMLKVIALILSAVTLVLTVIFLFGVLISAIPFDSLVATFIMTVIFTATYLLCLAGIWQVARWIPVILIYVIATYGALIGGGGAPAMVLFVLAFFLAALLIGRKVQIIVMGISLLTYVLIYTAQVYQILPQHRFPETAYINRIILVTGTYACLAWLIWFLMQQFDQALTESRTKELLLQQQTKELSQANELLQDEFRERSRAEDALRESEFRFRLLAENATDILSRHSLEGTYLYVSPACFHLTGYLPEEMTGRVAYEFAHPESFEIIRDMFARAQKGEDTVLATYEIRHKEGWSVWFETHCHLVHAFEHRDMVEIQCVSRDITARKQAEDALRESEKKYREMADLLPQVIFETDLSGRFTFVNQIGLTLFGYDQEALESGIHIWDILTEDDMERAKSAFIDIIQGGIDHNNQYRVKRSDGVIIPALVYSTPVRLHNQPVGIRGVLIDITDRLIAEERLKESEERYRSVFENAPFGIFHSTEAGIYLDVNPMMAKIFEYDSPEEMIREVNRVGISTAIYVGDDSRPDVVAEAIASGGWTKYEMRYRCRTGRIILANLIFRKYGEGEDGEALLEGFIEDVTVRKLAEENLRESEEIFRNFLRQSYDGLMLIDAGGKITEWNEAFEKSSGYSTQEILGLPIWEFHSLICPEEERCEDQRRQMQEQYERILKEGSISFTQPVEFRYRKKNGEIGYYEQTVFPVETNRGIHLGMVAREITERKKAEEEIIHLNVTLEQRVRERTLQLEAANKELEAFSYSVSHDLRAPLRSIEGFSLALEEDYRDLLGDPGRKSIDRIHVNVQRMSTLIEDLLKLSRLSRSEMNVSDVNLSRLAQEICDELVNRDPGRKAEFIIQSDVICRGDAHLLRVVLDNLLSNAWKFTSRNEHTRIEFGKTDQADHRAVYFVRDNGIGFEMEYVNKLFGAFQRLHSATEFPGTGIGLATVQRIVRRHGGQVWAEGKPKEGAVFSFSLD